MSASAGSPAHSIAILDDYTNSAFKFASQSSWDALSVPITHFTSAIPSAELVSTLKPFSIVCAMRERTKLTREVLEQLPNLKFVATTGGKNRGIAIAYLEEQGIPISGTETKGGNTSSGTVEQTWALILALSRRVVVEHESVVGGGWQVSTATGLNGKTLGLVGVGRLGSAVAKVAKAFGMRVIGWSPNLTQERATAAGVELAASLDALLSTADVVSLHLVFAPSTKGIIGARELGLLKKTAFLVNTSRGPLIDEDALLEFVKEERIAGVGLDVYGEEPLPKDAEIRKQKSVVLSPHMGYVDDTTYEAMWPQTVENIKAFLEGKPIRLLQANPAPGTH